jgi:poly(A) polymerase
MTPVGRLPPQKWLRAVNTRQVVAALSAEGGDVRFVGGCVRDALVGRPVKDVDIATHLPPDQVMRLLQAAGIKAVPTGLAHGTVTAVAGGQPFEVTTLREDVETYGRRAKVAFTDDWTADAGRRDFTFNALSCAPDGTLYDPFGGIADLRAGRVRFVGDARARIEEDYLRLLRLFRFQAHYGRKPIEPAVLAIARETAPMLRQLSGERVQTELLKLLAAPDPTPVVASMIEHSVLPEALPVTGTADVLRALLRAEDKDAAVDPLLRLAALIEPRRTAAETVVERLRLSRRQHFALVYWLAPPIDPGKDVPARERRRAARKLGAAIYGKLLRLDWARKSAGKPRARPGARLAAALAEGDRLAGLSFPVHGRDVLALGVPEGPALGDLLDQVEDWWAERDFRPTRRECLRHLKALASTG